MRLVYVALLCLLPRLAALYWFPPDASVLYYWAASDDILSTGAIWLDGTIDTSLEPMYPALLAVLRAITGDDLRFALGGQAVIGSIAGVFIYSLTDRLAGRVAAIVAAVLYALDPYLVRQSVSPVEITVCTTLLAGAAWSYARGDSARSAAVVGVLLAAATLTRFSLLPVAAGALGLLLWRRRWTQAVAFAVAVAVPVGSWMLRTHAINGAVVPTRVGINLFVSTNEYAGQVVPLHNADLLVPWAYDTLARDVDAATLTDVERQRAFDDALVARAVTYARAHPAAAAGLKLRNLAYTVAPVLLPLERKPRSAVATIEGGRVRISGLEARPIADHLIYSASRVLLLAGAVVGLMRRRGCWLRGDGLLLVIAASVIGVQALFFPTSRLLAPMAFVLMFYTAVAVEPLRVTIGATRPRR